MVEAMRCRRCQIGCTQIGFLKTFFRLTRAVGHLTLGADVKTVLVVPIIGFCGPFFLRHCVGAVNHDLIYM